MADFFPLLGHSSGPDGRHSLTAHWGSCYERSFLLVESGVKYKRFENGRKSSGPETREAEENRTFLRVVDYANSMFHFIAVLQLKVTHNHKNREQYYQSKYEIVLV